MPGNDGTGKIDISNVVGFVNEDGEEESSEDPVDRLRIYGDDELIELHEELRDSLNEPRSSEFLGALVAVQGELISRGLCGYRVR